MKTVRALAVVIDKETKKEIDSFEFTFDWYGVAFIGNSTMSCFYAKLEALKIFEQKQKYQPNLRKHQNYYIDAIVID